MPAAAASVPSHSRRGEWDVAHTLQCRPARHQRDDRTRQSSCAIDDQYAPGEPAIGRGPFFAVPIISRSIASGP